MNSLFARTWRRGMIKIMANNPDKPAIKPDPVMTATEVAERSEAFFSAIRERENITGNSIRDEMATMMADIVIKHISDDLSPQAWLERLIAIRDGEK